MLKRGWGKASRYLQMVFINTLLMVSNNAVSSEIINFQLKLGGWSDHYISGGRSDYNFNESHEGLGFAFSGVDPQIYFLNGQNVELWYMKDSFYEDSVQLSYGLFHRYDVRFLGLKNIDLGINFVAVSRSTADINETTAKLENKKRLHALVMMPSLSLYSHQDMHLDFVFLPAIPTVSDYSVLFFRFGFNLF